MDDWVVRRKITLLSQSPKAYIPAMPGEPFWRRKTLEQMTVAEWESLCDGCDLCRCSNYAERHKSVPDCIKLTPHNIEALEWMPKSCAYRRLHEGRDLAEWHPLISGDPESVHRAGISVRGQTINETALRDPEDALDFAAWDLIVERGDD